ncbi:MAG: hypothetical protein H8K10_01600 [Nitrospira sp.]|nr:hypothetical protein [Nitrospira sp.]
MTQPPNEGLSSTAVLDLWEQGVNRHPIDRALLLLQHACPEETFESLCDWSVGARDARLLALRRDTFGDRIESYAECPDCHNGLEFDLSCEELLASAVNSGPGWRVVEQGGRSWELRGPTSRDLVAAAAATDLAAARRLILSRCVRGAGRPVDEAGWTDEVQQVLTVGLNEVDPLAEILIDLSCQVCGRQWQSLFDVVGFLWHEIQTRSRRLLQEVDLLARTYGWTEREILRLGEQRRSLYVGMALS